MIRNPYLAIALVVLVLVAGVPGCAIVPVEPSGTPTATSPTPGGASVPPRRGGILVVSDGVGVPRHFNPALVSGSATAIIGTQIFASPLRYDENWNPQPYLAQSWEISADGLAVTLHLVEGATFHDGHPITSEDVAFSVMTVKQYHPFKSMFAPVDRVDTPDPHTAVIRLARPHPAILLAMSPALLPILPRHVYGDGQDLLTHPANLAPVGSGPFKLVRYTPGESVVLERYEGYFIPGRPYLDGIVFRLEDDPNAQVIDMERQEAHLLPLFTDFAGLDRLSSQPYLVVTPRGIEGLGPLNWLAFNLLRQPLDDRRVRQAIAYAVDPDFIIQYMNRGKGERALSPIAPASPFYTANVHKYDLDLNRANQLLDAAGYPIRPDGTRLALTLDYIPAIPSQQRDVALYLSRQLAQIGIDVQVRQSASFPAWAERIGNWDFDMTMDIVYNWGDPVIGVHRTYLTDNIRQGVVWSNTQNYANPRVDELLAQAEQEIDIDKRQALYAEFQQIVTEDVPIVWINVLPIYTVYNAALGNPPLSIWGCHSPLDEVYWQAPLTRVYAPIPTLDSHSSRLQVIGVRALEVLQAHNLYDARDILRDPAQGFLDREGAGLHVLGFTRQGTVFLDNSGQLKPGMSISGIRDSQGASLLAGLLQAAQGDAQQGGGGNYRVAGGLPNPVTQEVGLMAAWCGLLTPDDVICVLEWEQ
ncbi:MAG: ABC transporter substrate-binding protein [Chloroflexi bacterium]|nr:ABC transporter substrate-binding protein [Chloroflexota bacterium]